MMEVQEIIKKQRERTDKVRKEIDDIYQRRMAKETVKSIAAQYKVSQSTISVEVSEYCVKYNKPKPERNKSPMALTEEQKKAIQEAYRKNQMTRKELADEYDVSVSTIAKSVWNLPKNPKEDIQDQKEKKVSGVIELYKSGKSIAEIKNTLGMPPNEVRVILRNYMDVKERKLSPKSIEVLQNLGYNIELIRKVAAAKGIEEVGQKGEERE